MSSCLFTTSVDIWLGLRNTEKMFLIAVHVISFLLLGQGHGLSVDNCPYPLYGHMDLLNGTCYWFVDEHLKTFWGARDKCTRWGGSLVIIKTEELNTYIQRQLNHYKITDNAWIGLTDMDVEGDFIWEDGTRAKDYFTNWGVGDGVDYFRPEDCVTMDPSDGKWRDEHCEKAWLLGSNERPFVCQIEPITHTSTKASTTATVGQTSDATITTPIARPTCPPFVCPLDCGMDGYILDKQGCSLCQCDDTTSAPTTQASNEERPTCPPFVCALDCGMDGYIITDRGCYVCQCDD